MTPKRSKLLGLMAGFLSSLFSGRKSKPSPRDMKRMDFKTSTSKIGVRFTDKIRNTFRSRWLKKSRKY